MSEIKLTVRDSTRSVHGTVHGSRVDYLVAAMSADPETLEELQAALERFLPDESSWVSFNLWSSGIDTEPWDAGVCIIDLAARLVVIDSSYSHPGHRGVVDVTDAQKDSKVMVRYHVEDDWLFTDQMEAWEHIAEERRRKRLAVSRVEPREVLYGRVCSFIAETCWDEAVKASQDKPDKEAVYQILSAIHARWLMTPRRDLNGQAPR